MDLQTFFTSKQGTGLALLIGRYFPRWAAVALIRPLTRTIAGRAQSPLTRSIRANQSVARDLPLDAPELDQVVLEVLRNAAYGYYDFYHQVAKGKDGLEQAISFDPGLDDLLQQAKERNQGTFIVGAHTSNFDLAMIAFGVRGIPIQAISYAAPPGGYQLQNKLRTDAGFIITPASSEAVKTAIERLRRGGIVATGVDRPLPEDSKKVLFFGRPAALPTGHVRIALFTGAQMLFMWLEKKDQAYHVHMTPVELVRTGDRQHDIAASMERVLARAEEVIRARPHEWMMFHPLWPELLSQETR